MVDDVNSTEGTPESEQVGDSVLLNWGCTNCGYRVEGAAPEKCPECGADQQEFEEIPIPGY